MPQAIHYAIISQSIPVILSIAPSGTILGIVGAGGIGFLLADRMHAFRWPEAWSIIFLIIAMVYLIDAASAWLRKRLTPQSSCSSAEQPRRRRSSQNARQTAV